MDSLPYCIKQFLDHCKFERNLSPKTIKSYTIDLTQFLDLVESKIPTSDISQISKNEIKDFLISISQLKPKSVKRKIATLKSLFNFLEFEDKIKLNPFRKMRIRIKENDRLPKIMNIKEIGKILKVAYREIPNDVNLKTFSYFEGLRNVIIIELLFATGGRVSEISNLTDNSIDLNSGSVIIKGKGNKERIIQICNQEVLKILKEYRKLKKIKMLWKNDFLLINRLGNRFSEQSIRFLVKNISIKAGITKHITPHVFRHSFATLLLEKDVDIKYIQSFLGHSSILTTQIYTHVNNEKQRKILRSKHPRKDMALPTLVF